jgi:hypothetical protein
MVDPAEGVAPPPTVESMIELVHSKNLFVHNLYEMYGTGRWQSHLGKERPDGSLCFFVGNGNTPVEALIDALGDAALDREFKFPEAVATLRAEGKPKAQKRELSLDDLL